MDAAFGVESEVSVSHVIGYDEDDICWPRAVVRSTGRSQIGFNHSSGTWSPKPGPEGSPSLPSTGICVPGGVL